MSDSEKKADVSGRTSWWLWLAILLVIITSAIIRGRLAVMPLERDEGEYAYIGQQMLKGVPPYVSAYSMKLPGIYIVYAVILAVFGQTQTGIHFGLIVFNSATIFVIFLLTRRLFGGLAGVAAGCAYAILSLLKSVLGLTANAEHFVLLPALIGVLILARPAERRSKLTVFISAIFFGLAFITKQHGILFAIFGALYLFYGELCLGPVQWKRVIVSQLVFISGVVIHFVLICLWYWRAGLFDKFWFWTFTYAREYATTIPLEAGWWILKNKFSEILQSAILIWILAFAGLISVLVRKAQRKYAFFVISFLIFSFLAVCPGLYFRSHYFIFLFPAVAILAGAGFEWLSRLITFLSGRISGHLRWPVIIIAGLVVVGISIYQQRLYLFELTTTDICRLFYDGNPFPESLEIGNYIKNNSSSNDKIAVVGSEPQIYFYADRLAATGYIYTYPLMETHQFVRQMQAQMIGEIESAKPEWLVFVHVQASWIMRPESTFDIFNWSSDYARNFYDKVGVIDIPPDEQTIYKWNEQAANYNPASEHWVGVFKRKH